MDFSKFQDDNFDVKDWVNGAFRTCPPGTSKDQYATTLVMKLQMFIQEVNNVIEDASQQSIQNLPRVMRDVEAVRQESVLLQEQMRMVKEDIEKVEHDTANSMQNLLRLDNVKSKMKAASDALQEADNWTTLSSDVEEVFKSQDIQAISAKLVGMQQSLQMLTDVPDYAERVEHLESLKNRLEAMLSPQLIAAFTAQSLESAQTYVKIFQEIERLPQIYKYYNNCIKSQLIQHWRSIVEKDPDETLIDWLPELYDLLLSTWHSKIKWCSQVFDDPVEILCHLLKDTLDSLDPSLPHCIVTLLEKRNDPLNTLVELKEISDRFAKSMENTLDNYTSGYIAQPHVDELVNTIYAPYRRHIMKYGAFEERVLSEELDLIALDAEEIIDTVRLLGDSVSKLFAVANSACERCVKFTDGCGFPDLLQALQSYFTKYIKEFRRVLVNIREKSHLENVSQEEDWTLFQHSMRIIQTCGDLILHTDEFDQSIISEILNSVGKHYQPPSPSIVSPNRKKSINPFQDHKKHFLENVADQEALDNLLEKLEEGETPSVLLEVHKDMCQLSEDVHKYAFDIVFAQLKIHLVNLSNLEVWIADSSGGALTGDLPIFSLSPQEYITKIGQYLLTLPQQLEPFTMEENPTVIAALRHGRLPFTDDQELPEHIADLWLQSLARGTMHMYCEEILRIHHLTSHASKQLQTDIDYLCNVLDDLGLHASDSLKNISTLIGTPVDQIGEVSETMPQRLTSAVIGMRNLKLK